MLIILNMITLVMKQIEQPILRAITHAIEPIYSSTIQNKYLTSKKIFKSLKSEAVARAPRKDLQPGFNQTRIKLGSNSDETRIKLGSNTIPFPILSVFDLYLFCFYFAFDMNH